MKNKMFRVFADVNATDKYNAVNKILNMIVPTKYIQDSSALRVQENPLDDEEEGIILELARVALSDAKTHEFLADKLDLSDKELKRLQKKIEDITNR